MSGTRKTINFPTQPNEGDLYASGGRVYEFLDKTWHDVTSVYTAPRMRYTEPPQDGELYMRTRPPGAVAATWRKPKPLDLTPYYLRDGSQPLTAPLLLPDGPAVSEARVQALLAPLRAEIVRLRDYIGAMERPDDPRGRARGRTY